MRLGLRCVLAIAGLAMAGAAAAETDPERVERLRRLMKPAAPVEGTEGKRPIGAGSGFFVSDRLVVTNHHVIAPCASLTIRIGGEGDRFPARVVGSDEKADLALVETTTRAPASALLAAEPASAIARDLVVIGFPERGRITVRPTILAATYRGLEGTPPRFTFGADIRQGHSGSPVLDRNGAVVGVVTMKADTVRIFKATGRVVDDIGVAVTLETLRHFLRTHRAEPPVLRERPLDNAGVFEAARGFVAQIGCWG